MTATILTTLLVLLGSRAGLPSSIPVETEIAAVAVLHGVPIALALAVAYVETGHVRDPDRAIGHDGEIGRFQVMPRYALGCDLHGHHCNIATGVAWLAVNLQRCGGDWSCAAEVYNAGHVGTVKGRVYAAKVLRVARGLRVWRGW